ncbi:MAG: TIGR02147 family protein [Bdellovibrionales bacterium]
MMHDQIYFREVLAQELASRCRRNSTYSLRAFSNAMGVSPGTISQILSGKRIPSAKLAKKFMSALGLSPKETLHFLNSVAKAQRARELKRRSPFFRDFDFHVSDIPDNTQELGLELFQAISDWHHYAIMMLVETENAQYDPRWIAKQLGIRPLEAALALKRLLKLGLLKMKSGRLKVDGAFLTTADKNVTSPAQRKHQRQILEKAVHSLENDPLESRSMTSVTMAIDPDRIPKAKQMIEKFSRELCAYLEGGKRKQVYQLGVCLFPIQRGRGQP